MYRHMSFVARKPVFGICDKVRLKPACSATETWSWNSGYNKYGYYTIQAANNKGADQTARMRRLICTFVVRIWQKQVFSWRGSYLVKTYCKKFENFRHLKYGCNYPKIWTIWFYHRIIHPKDADRMTNSVEPDQNAPSVWSGSTLFAPDWSVWKLRIFRLYPISVAEKKCMAVIIKFVDFASFRLFEPRHEKTCLQGLQPGKTQTGLLSYRD